MKQVASKVDFHQTAWLYIPEENLKSGITSIRFYEKLFFGF
jgi:hypothetical protein